MIDMKLKPQSQTMLGEAEDDAPEYPYGLRICLDNEALEKLGITELPAIDADYTLKALVCVVRISQDESQGDQQRRSVDLQIEQMELAPAKEEAGEGMDAAQRLYPNR